jgi:two-component system chemotaxis sensor kinase CheA
MENPMDQRENLIQVFITESRENIDLLDQKIVRLEQEPDSKALLDEIFRAFHTLKGNSGLVGMARFEKIAHITEEILTQVREGKRRINTEVINFLLDSLDQLKILHDSIEENGTDDVTLKRVPAPDDASSQKTAPKPIKSKSAGSAGNKAKPDKSEKTVSGKNELGDEIAEDESWGIFADNLRQDRESAEIVAEDDNWEIFPETILRAYHEGGQVNLEIIDDGKGIDPEKIRAKAVEKGLLTVRQANSLGERDTINLIFRPGFSTAAKVTNISGRGVGMDVVKTNVEKIGGTVEVLSEVGKGSTIRIKIPLTLAIIPALIVTSGGQRFAIPQINLLELVRLEGEAMKNIERMGNAEIYRLRGKLLPIVRLNRILIIENAQKNRSDSLSIAVLAAGETQFGLIVDRIHDTEEIVVKPLSKHLKNIMAFAGATVMGDGKVALILDVVGLADTARIMMEENRLKMREKQSKEKTFTQNHTLLLFSIHRDEQLAIPLALVSRLETFDASLVQVTGHREVIKYHGRILPLLRVENYIDVKPPQQKETISVIVFSVENNEVGFIVSEIIDIVNSSEAIDTASLQQKGVLGSTIINERITMIIDAYTLIVHEYPDWFDKKSKAMLEQHHGEINQVLIVDDSPFIRAIERSYLESEGYHVIEANNGDEALERMTVNQVDLILTDIEMPKMDGIELTRNIRADSHLKNLPIVAVSSLARPEDLQRGYEAGVNAYLKKLNRNELMQSLEQALNMQRKN